MQFWRRSIRVAATLWQVERGGAYRHPEIGFEGVDAGHLDDSRNIENLDLRSWDSLPTDPASETALRRALM